jgi:peroxiredoxin
MFLQLQTIDYKMKKIIQLVIISVIIISTCQAQKQSYTLSVDVSQFKEQVPKIYLLYFLNTPNGPQDITDSAKVISGKAIFKGTIAEPAFALLQTVMFGSTIRFAISSGNISVNVGETWDKFTITGNAVQRDFTMLLDQQTAHEIKLQSISGMYNAAISSGDSVKAKSYNSEYMQANREIFTEVYKGYVITHGKTNPLSVFALSRFADTDLPGADSLYNLLLPAYKKLPTAILLKKKFDIQKSTSIGQPAPLFSQADTSGKMISLASLRGKYVFLDFWASWCHPCREESPNLVNAYGKFHAQNFEIISVSLDSKTTKKAWIKAINDDQVAAWIHVSDLKGWKNDAAELYSVKSVPANYLIDPAGKIIAKNLRGKQLEEKLAEVLGTK